MFEHKVGDLIYYMYDNKVAEAPVLARHWVENNPEFNRAGNSLFAPWGETRIEYKTCHGTIQECDAFQTKDALLASL